MAYSAFSGSAVPTNVSGSPPVVTPNDGVVHAPELIDCSQLCAQLDALVPTIGPTGLLPPASSATQNTDMSPGDGAASSGLPQIGLLSGLAMEQITAPVAPSSL